MKKRCHHHTITLASLFVALAIMSSVPARAQLSVVVSNSSSHTADSNVLKQIFAGVKLKWPGGERIGVVTQSDNATEKAFYENFVGKSLSQTRNDWSRLVLTGQASAPKRCSGDDAVKKAVAENADAIGFIATSSLDGSVKEIYRVMTFSRSK